jgi:hypothetical protein
VDVPFAPVSGTDQLSERLREVAERLRDPDLDAEQAEALAREAADLAGEASAEIETALRRSRMEEGS